jgi:hypothetical protein
MPATDRRNQGKTQFVQELLSSEPYANARRVREAWQEAGNEGSISQTLVNKQRSLMGLTGNIKGGRPRGSGADDSLKLAYTGKKRGRKPKAESATESLNGHAPAAPRAKSGADPGQLTQLEAEIDRLLFRVMGLGGLETIEDSLRLARRQLYQALDA